MTIQQANQYFAALPDGFADPEQLGALLPASVQQVQFVGVAGTAGKTAVARLLTAILRAQGIRAGVYHAGCEPLAARVRVEGEPVDEALLCRAADALAAHEELPLQAAELAAAAGFLALVTTTGSLAVAGGGATAFALIDMGRTHDRSKFVQIHLLVLLIVLP